MTDPELGVTQYTYNAVGSLIGTAMPNGTTPTRTIDYLYDAVGNRLSRSDLAEGTTA